MRSSSTEAALGLASAAASSTPMMVDVEAEDREHEIAAAQVAAAAEDETDSEAIVEQEEEQQEMDEETASAAAASTTLIQCSNSNSKRGRKPKIRDPHPQAHLDIITDLTPYLGMTAGTLLVHGKQLSWDIESGSPFSRLCNRVKHARGAIAAAKKAKREEMMVEDTATTADAATAGKKRKRADSDDEDLDSASSSSSSSSPSKRPPIGSATNLAQANSHLLQLNASIIVQTRTIQRDHLAIQQIATLLKQQIELGIVAVTEEDTEKYHEHAVPVLQSMLEQAKKLNNSGAPSQRCSIM